MTGTEPVSDPEASELAARLRQLRSRFDEFRGRL